MSSQPTAKASEPEKMDVDSVETNAPPALDESSGRKALINILSYPHILHTIIEYSANPALRVLLRCSKAIFHPTSKQLYRSLYITREALHGLIEVGNGWRDSEAISDSSFSPSLRSCLLQVRTLHVVDYIPGTTEAPQPYPDVPPGCLDNVSSVVLHIAATSRDASVNFQPFFHHLGGAAGQVQAYIWSTPAQVRSPEGTVLVNLEAVPGDFDKVTLLLPHPYRSFAPPEVHLLSPVAEGFEMDLVLMAWRPSEEENAHQYHDLLAGNWIDDAEQSYHLPDDPTIRVIGAEHTGLFSAEQNELFPQHTRMEDGSLRPRQLAFVPFADWLENHEPGGLFSHSQFAAMWYEDWALMWHIWGQKKNDPEHDISDISIGKGLTPEQKETLEAHIAHEEELNNLLVKYRDRMGYLISRWPDMSDLLPEAEGMFQTAHKMNEGYLGALQMVRALMDDPSKRESTLAALEALAASVPEARRSLGDTDNA